MDPIDARPKIEVAKEVLSGLVGDLPADVVPGLVVFGHRRKDDCSDIEVVVSPNPSAAQQMIEKIPLIQALGKTPLRGAIHTAAEQLYAGAGERTIVLVSDGVDTCETDPNALILELAQKKIAFKIYVVGFDVTSKERGPLESIARESGGQYFDAASAAQLKEALGKVREAVLEKRPAPPQLLALPPGADRPEAAGILQPGEYLLNRAISGGVQEYYAVKVKAGQTLAVRVRAPGTPNPYAGAAIYNEDGEQVADGSVIGQPSGQETIAWSTNSAKPEYVLCFGIGHAFEGEANAMGTVYRIGLRDDFDAGSGTDAGDAFDTALEIQPGNYKGFLAGSWGDDHADVYKMSLKAKEALTVTAVPPAGTQIKVSVFDQDRALLSEDISANPGALVRTSWESPSSQEVYVMIEPDPFPDRSAALPYTVEMTVDKGGA